LAKGIIELKGGAKMPKQFKALASIGAWVLFIMGLLNILYGWVAFFRGVAAGIGEDVAAIPAWSIIDTAIITGAVMIALSVCIMILRKKME
jgi:hypothetical protein